MHVVLTSVDKEAVVSDNDLRSLAISVGRTTLYPSSPQVEDQFCVVIVSALTVRLSPEVK